jgi:hypothetical protein
LIWNDGFHFKERLDMQKEGSVRLKFYFIRVQL